MADAEDWVGLTHLLGFHTQTTATQPAKYVSPKYNKSQARDTTGTAATDATDDTGVTECLRNVS